MHAPMSDPESCSARAGSGASPGGPAGGYGPPRPSGPRARSPALWCALVVLGPAVLTKLYPASSDLCE